MSHFFPNDLNDAERDVIVYRLTLNAKRDAQFQNTEGVKLKHHPENCAKGSGPVFDAFPGEMIANGRKHGTRHAYWTEKIRYVSRQHWESFKQKWLELGFDVATCKLMCQPVQLGKCVDYAYAVCSRTEQNDGIED